MRQFTFLQLLDDTLSRYEQIEESFFSVNDSTEFVWNQGKRTTLVSQVFREPNEKL